MINLNCKLKKAVRLLYPLLAATVLLTGCGMAGQGENTSGDSEQITAPEQTDPPRQAIDWVT